MKKIIIAMTLFVWVAMLIQAEDKIEQDKIEPKVQQSVQSPKSAIDKNKKNKAQNNIQKDTTSEENTKTPYIQAASSSEQTSKQLLQCNAIFDARKGELKEQIRQLDEKTQSIQALENATQNLLDKREAKLKERENALSIKLKEIEDKEAKEEAQNKQRQDEIKALIAKNEDILKQIDGAKNNKLAQTYAKMKDSKAAPIIENLPQDEAASILFALSAQDMGKILSKMNPKKAAELTEILKKGPPFEKQKSETLQKKNPDKKETGDVNLEENQDKNTQDSSI